MLNWLLSRKASIPAPAPTPAPKPRFWACNPDGTPYLVGMTVGQLRQELSRLPDTSEVCMAIKNRARTRELTGKLTDVYDGAANQIWIIGKVLDPDQE